MFILSHIFFKVAFSFNECVNRVYSFIDYSNVIVLFLALLSCVCQHFFKNKEHDDDFWAYFSIEK